MSKARALAHRRGMNPTVADVSPRIVTRAEWLAARVDLLRREKELTRQRDELARQRRALPWVAIDEPYRFATAAGPRTLGELFAGRSQLIVKHFMLAPGWREGCVGCSFELDHVDGALVHLENHDVKFVAVARAPLAEIAAFQERMGWRCDWASSHGSAFNFDFGVSFAPDQIANGTAVYNYRAEKVPSEELSGFSVFARHGERVFHTYSTFGRGAEEVLATYMLLDLTPNGRNEPAAGNLTDWVRHHDRYGAGGHVDATGRYVAPASKGCCGGGS
jgi:predicted dithiol-disulfide oxidoreductase (DUF899 family)